MGRAWRGKARVVSPTRGDARQSSPGSALGLAAGRHGGVKKKKQKNVLAPDTMLGLDLARTHASHNGSGEHAHAHSIERALSYPTT